MALVLGDKPGPLVVTTWTSDFDLDAPLLVFKIYICQFNACHTDNPVSSAEHPPFTPARRRQGFGFPFVSLIFDPTRHSLCAPVGSLLVWCRILMAGLPSGNELSTGGGKRYPLI